MIQLAIVALVAASSSIGILMWRANLVVGGDAGWALLLVYAQAGALAGLIAGFLASKVKQQIDLRWPVQQHLNGAKPGVKTSSKEPALHE